MPEQVNQRRAVWRCPQHCQPMSERMQNRVTRLVAAVCSRRAPGSCGWCSPRSFCVVVIKKGTTSHDRPQGGVRGRSSVT